MRDIVGMPRSGSTLIEQILASHPDVYGAGEVKYLSRALSQSRDRFPSLPKFPHIMEKLSPAQLELMGRSYLNQLCPGSNREYDRSGRQIFTLLGCTNRHDSIPHFQAKMISTLFNHESINQNLTTLFGVAHSRRERNETVSRPPR